MSDWKTVAGQLAGVGAPILGRIIGEFIPIPGGGMLAEWGIRKLTEALGIPVDSSPASVANSIQNTPPDVLKTRLETAEREAEDRYQALTSMHKATAEQNTASATAINETVRAEVAAGVQWWHWRHLCGYLVFGGGVMLMMGGAKILMFGGDLAALSALITALTPIYLALCALNGYVAADTTALRMAAITGQPTPTGTAAVIEAVKPRKK